MDVKLNMCSVCGLNAGGFEYASPVCNRILSYNGILSANSEFKVETALFLCILC